MKARSVVINRTVDEMDVLISVDPADMGRVIGEGRTAKRSTLLRAGPNNLA